MKIPANQKADMSAIFKETDALLPWLWDERGLEPEFALRVLLAAATVIANGIDRPDIYEDEEAQ